MKLLGRQVKNSAFIWTKYPECDLHCVCTANFVAFLCEAQLCFHKNITSAPVLSSSSKCSGIPLNVLWSQPAVLLHLLPTGLLCTAHPSIIVFPWIHSILPTLSGVYEVSFVTRAIISRLLCCSCSVRDIWTSAAYVLFLMSFPIVFLLNYSAPPSPLKFFPALLNIVYENPFQFYLGVFFSLPICFPFTVLLGRWVGFWLNILFSLWKMLSILSQISVIPTFEVLALK